MDLYVEFTIWAFKPQIWIILGILLVIADIFLGYDFFVLPTGVAAFIIAAILYGQKEQWFGDAILFETWHDIGLAFAVLSVASIALLKFGLQRNKKEEPDINDY